MRLRSLASAIVGAMLLATAAQAEAVRLPLSGDPAFIVDLPDGWMHRVDDSGNLILGSPDHSAGFSFSFFEFSGELDAAAAEVMKVAKADPPQNEGPIEVSGYRGYIYESAMANDSGIPLKVHCIMVRLDPTHVASMFMVSDVNASAEQYVAARDVLNAVTLTGKSQP